LEKNFGGNNDYDRFSYSRYAFNCGNIDMEEQKIEKDFKKYCGSKDICTYKDHYVSNECFAFKQNNIVWRTCPHKWQRDK